MVTYKQLQWQNHLSEVTVDTDTAKRKMNTVATFSVVRSFEITFLVITFVGNNHVGREVNTVLCYREKRLMIVSS